jgi:hypothetical protein
MITLKDIVNGQQAIVSQRAEDNRFKGDFEPIEFCKSDYDSMWLVDTDHSGDKFIEKVVAVKDTDMYLLTASTSSFNGQKQINFIQQELTLQGFNYFTKDIDEDFSSFYNQILEANGYNISLQDVIDLGEFKPELNGCTILQFKDDKDNTHYLTVNKYNQLSKITVKLSGRPVGNTKTSQSAFGF